MPTEVPTKEPKVIPVKPAIEPARRMNPDTLCPDQTEKVIEIIREGR